MSEAIPSHWEESYVSEHYDLLIGGTPSRNNSDYWDQDSKTDNKWVSIKDIKHHYIFDTAERISDLGVKKSNVKLIPENTVIMSFKLTIGRLTITKCPLYTNEAIVSFIPKEPYSVDNDYLYYGLQSWNLLEEVDQAVKGATLNKDKMSRISGLFPPLPEQKKIASILTSVDEVIETTQKQIDKLQDLKKATMNELLTKGIGHTEFKDSELGRIPKSWEVRRLGELIGSLTGGVSVNSENRTKGAKEMGILKTSCISKGAFFSSEHKTILASEISRVSTPVQRGKIIFSRMNTPNLVGESGYVSEVTEGLYLPDRLWLIDVEDQGVTFIKWLSWLLVSRDVRTQITHIATGTSGSMKNISKPNLLSLPVAVPTLEEQKKIALTIDTIDAKIKNHSQKLSQTQSLKKSLMQDLLTGKVRVRVN